MKLDYFGKRYYDAEIGRWVGTDPAHEFSDLYRYTLNPISHSDPNGATDVAISVGIKYGLLDQGEEGAANASLNVNRFANSGITKWIANALDKLDNAISRGVAKNRSKEESGAVSIQTTIHRGPQLGIESAETASITLGSGGTKTYGATLTGAAGWVGALLHVSLNFDEGHTLPTGISFTGGYAQGAYAGATIDKTTTDIQRKTP